MIGCLVEIKTHLNNSNTGNWTASIDLPTNSSREDSVVINLSGSIKSIEPTSLALHATLSTLLMVPPHVSVESVSISSKYVVNGIASPGNRYSYHKSLWDAFDQLFGNLCTKWTVYQPKALPNNLHEIQDYPLTGKLLVAYTDGACSGNPGPGAWGALVEVRKNGELEHKFEGYGTESSTTNNRMELKSAISILKLIPNNQPTIIYTDSKYLKDGITSWIRGWKAKNWRTSNGKPVKNVDLWKELDALCQGHQVEWNLVKGHSTNEGNNRADFLATSAIQELING